MENKTIRVIQSPSENNPFLVFSKPKGLPSAPLEEGGESALTQAVKLFPEIKNVNGLKKVEGGLVHRIDTETEGLLLAAVTQDAFDFLINEQKNGRFIKEYEAVCRKSAQFPEGFDSLKKETLLHIENTIEEINSVSFSVTSGFRSWGKGAKEVRPVFEWSNTASQKKSSARGYTTDITLQKEGSIYKAFCRINKGFRHQVRAHLCA
ncbi:MAG: RNA pseudouridine synthase, partial [Treponema sp.]|nr:RNA pseudouridine synthase [Treponema sp.]